MPKKIHPKKVTTGKPTQIQLAPFEASSNVTTAVGGINYNLNGPR